MARTAIQALVTKTGTFTPGGSGVAISTLATDCTLVIVVKSLTGGNARLVWQDSIDNFTGHLTGPALSIAACATSRTYVWRLPRQYNDFRVGVSLATARVILEALGGSSITYSAYIY